MCEWLHCARGSKIPVSSCLRDQSKLRIGLAEQSVLTALAHSTLLERIGAKDKDGKLADHLEHATQIVKQAYSECPSYDVVRFLSFSGGSKAE